MKICVHTIVRNEDVYVWYAVMSVIEYVDKIMIWDTGSTDGTADILKWIKSKYPNKVDLKFVGEVTPDEFTAMRRKMLEETKEDWVILVDADEVWWKDHIKNLTDIIRESGEKYETIINRYINPIGDLFHMQEEKASRYMIDGIMGNLTIRAMNRKIPGLTIEKPHGTQAYYDKNGRPIQERAKSKRYMYDHISYMHMTHMARSTDLFANNSVPKRSFKYKYEIGEEVPLDYYYPEVFFVKRPEFVPNVWYRADEKYKRRAYLETYLKKGKRRLLPGKDGY